MSIKPAEHQPKLDGLEAVSKVYELRPPGLSFGEPASLEIVSEGAPQEASVYIYKPVLERWKRVRCRRGGRYLIAEVSRFPPHRCLFGIMVDVSPPERPVMYELPDRVSMGVIDVIGEAEPESIVQLLNNGESFSLDRADEEGFFRFTNVRLNEGSNRLEVVAIDEVGKRSRASEPKIMVVDTGSPKRVYRVQIVGSEKLECVRVYGVRAVARDVSPRRNSLPVHLTSSVTDRDGIYIEAVETGGRTGESVGFLR